jgi:hypothetical protein
MAGLWCILTERDSTTDAHCEFDRLSIGAMKHLGLKLAFLLLALSFCRADAQTAVGDAPRNIAVSSRSSALLNAPFTEGEVLSYEAKFNKILRGIPAADLTLTVLPTDSPNDFTVKASAISKGTLLKLFRFSFEQQLQTSIDPVKFRALKTTKHDVQKDRVRDSEAIFNYVDRRVTFFERNPDEPMKAPRRIASSITDQTHDLISGLYALRLVPLAIGKSYDFTVSDSGLVYEVPVKVTAREMQKTMFGKIWCYRIEPQVFGPGRMIEQEGSFIIWISDDARRVPVRAQVNAPIGRVEIKLKSAENLK